MEEVYDKLKKDIEIFISDLNTQKVLGYTRKFGNLIGLNKDEKGNITVSPQYVLATQFLFPTYIGRSILLASTFAVMVSNE